MKFPEVIYSLYDGQEWVRVKDESYQPYSSKGARKRKTIVNYLDRFTLDHFGPRGETFSFPHQIRGKNLKRLLKKHNFVLEKKEVKEFVHYAADGSVIERVVNSEYNE